jgi:molybdopterin synthase catalytic subunit
MIVQVRLFARLREQAGTAEEELELADGATPAAVYAQLRRRHPLLDPRTEAVRPARNLSFCGWDDPVADGDEVAFIPPVSGGSEGILIEITADPLEVRRLEVAVAAPGAGAICTFTGTVRDSSAGRPVSHLEYEAYPEMAAAELNRIAEEIVSRWPRARVALAHRTGRLEVGEASVVVSVSCPHRAEAFDACRWGIDRLKESVPIWKREFGEDGAAWVEDEPRR